MKNISFIPASREQLQRPAQLTAASLCVLAALSACSTASDKPSPIANAVANTTAAIRADNDMLEVLRAHAALDPKAIEKIDVAEAHEFFGTAAVVQKAKDAQKYAGERLRASFGK